MDKFTVFIAAAMLALGVLVGTLVPDTRTASSGYAVEKPSPGNWIDKGDINVYNDQIIINIEGAIKAGVKDTNSMDPLIDSSSELIEIKPQISQIHAGDIISYEMDGNNNIVVHEVIETGYDSEGWYAVTKGYNNNEIDPEKVRAENVRGVVVGILY